jgi:hypothetical protein
MCDPCPYDDSRVIKESRQETEMNTLFADGLVRDHTDSMLRDAKRARLVKQADRRRKSRRDARRGSTD